MNSIIWDCEIMLFYYQDKSYWLDGYGHEMRRVRICQYLIMLIFNQSVDIFLIILDKDDETNWVIDDLEF